MTGYAFYATALAVAFLVSAALAFTGRLTVPQHTRAQAVLCLFSLVNAAAAGHWLMTLFWAALTAVAMVLIHRTDKNAPRPAWWNGDHEKIPASKETS